MDQNNNNQYDYQNKYHVSANLQFPNTYNLNSGVIISTTSDMNQPNYSSKLYLLFF